MPIASGPFVELRYIPETVRGTTPTTPQLKVLRATSRNINLTKNMLQSAEVRRHRQKRTVRHGFEQIGGGIGFEVCPQAHDDILAVALAGAWDTNVLKVGTTLTTLTMERAFADVNQYQVFRGVTVASSTLKIAPEGIVTCDITPIGMSGGEFSSTPLDATVEEAADTEPYTSFDGTISEGGTAIAVVTGLDITVNNNRSVQAVVGSKTSPDVFEGEAIISGNMTLFFQNVALFNKFKNESESSLSLDFNDYNNVQNLTLSMPRIKYSAAGIDPPPSGPIIITMPYMALYDATAATTLSLTRALAA